VAHLSAQVNIRDGDDINSGNDKFHENRHTSEVNKLRPDGAFLSHADERHEVEKWHISRTL
jgi:hypothetical protein